MARSAGSGQRWLIVATLLAQAVAQAAAPAQGAAAAGGSDKMDKKEKMEKVASPASAPDAALLEYLGRYAEAADGIDPLSFEMPDAVDPRNSARGQPR